jgi:hypothetical protein
MTKYIKPSGSYYTEFCTQRFDTGTATNADALPVATVMKNGVDDGISPTAWSTGITITGIDAGRYRITGTVPTSYTPGDIIDISVQAVVNSVTGKGVVDEFIVVSANVYDSLIGTGDYLDINLVQLGGSSTPVDGKSVEAALRYIAAICAGKISGAGTGVENFLGLDGVTQRVSVSTDESGNRTGVVYD